MNCVKMKHYLIVVSLQEELEEVKEMLAQGKISQSEYFHLHSQIVDKILKYIK